MKNSSNIRNLKIHYWLCLMLGILLGACSALNLMPSKNIETLKFDTNSHNEQYQFIYQTKENSPELLTLKTNYGLDSIAKTGNTEFEQILALLSWTNSRWKHSGSNEPSESNTLTILEEAEKGKKFRCVEYGIVLRSVLAVNGFKARTLGLKTKDVEVTLLGAGHVLTEVWSEQFSKWLMLDAQFNVVPTMNGTPLNAVEFQRAIIQKENFQLVDSKGEVDDKTRKKYMNFIPHYLYYFDYKFDQRELPYDSLLKINENGYLMLVPLGTKPPNKFQKRHELDYFEYTNSLKDFYKKPI
ncbi:transglutaminase domain-containing protein [Algoriphagus sp.]|uniref:transglutaminase domain-containing protein n=1 Tax=Algoriphagus sp. TaxID=1872435 RepID=UPI003919F2A5